MCGKTIVTRTDSLASGRTTSCGCAFADANIWQNTIRATLSDYRGGAWIGGTPRGQGFFAQLWAKGGQPGWASWQCPTAANPFIDPAEIAEARRVLPEHVFAQEYLAELIDDGANPFGLANLKACLQPLSTEPAVAFGVDLAKRHDFTVIIGLDSRCRVCSFERFQLPWHLTRQRILEVVGDVPTTIDESGVGDPIVEDLQRARANINGVVFNVVDHLEAAVAGVAHRCRAVAVDHVPRRRASSRAAIVHLRKQGRRPDQLQGSGRPLR